MENKSRKKFVFFRSDLGPLFYETDPRIQIKIKRTQNSAYYTQVLQWTWSTIAFYKKNCILYKYILYISITMYMIYNCIL